MKSIICTECDKKIIHKKDLVVSGKLLQPYHSTCLENPKSKLGKLHKFTGSFPVGIKFWILLIIGNLIMGIILRENPESITALIFFGLIFNTVFIFGRVGIYYSYEQYLE